MAQLPLPQTSDVNLSVSLSKWKSQLDPLLAASSSGEGYIGEVRMAFLTEAQFQSQAGSGWVLCDGRNVQTSSYSQMTGQITIPDMRSVVPRGKDNGRGLNPSGNLPLGTYTPDSFASHNHGVNDPHHSHEQLLSGGSGGSTGYSQIGGQALGYGPGQPGIGGPWNTTTVATGITIANSGSSETQMKNVTINFFIRIN